MSPSWGAATSPAAVRGRAAVGCSLHHPQPRGDLRIAAHTRPTADCPQGRSHPGPQPSRPRGMHWRGLGAHSDLVLPCRVGSRLDPSLSPECQGSPQAAHVRPGSMAAPGAALGGAERALDRHDIPDGSLAACSAGVIVSFQSRLSPGDGSCPGTARPCWHRESLVRASGGRKLTQHLVTCAALAQVATSTLWPAAGAATWHARPGS